jgi:hypothetical protein
MGVVEYRPEKTDRDGLHTLCNQSVQRLLGAVNIETNELRALIVDPLGYFFHQLARHERLGFIEGRAVRDLVFCQSLGDLAAHHMQGVAKTFGENQSSLGAGAGDQRIVTYGTSVKKQTSRS